MIVIESSKTSKSEWSTPHEEFFRLDIALLLSKKELDELLEYIKIKSGQKSCI